MLNIALIDLREVNARNNRPELVHPGNMGHRGTGVFGVTGKAEGLGAVEGDRSALLAVRLRVGASKGSLLRCLGLGILGRSWSAKHSESV